MTKEITKSIILQELQDRFKLREWEPSKFLFSEMVLPTYDISKHTEHPTMDYEELTVTATGAYKFFTVPYDETWHLNSYNVVFMGAGAFKVSGVYFYHARKVSAGSIMYLDLKEGQTVSYAVNLPKSVRLDPGDTLEVLVDDYTSSQNLRLYIEYIAEEIR